MDFKYEALSKYCLICGIMGHATRVCKKFLDVDRACGMVFGNLEDNLVYYGLDAETDLWGNPLRSTFRSGGSVGSNEGRRSLMRWREMRSDERDGSQRGLHSSLVPGMRGDGNTGSKGSLSEGHSVVREEYKLSDAGGSSSKFWGFLCQNKIGGTPLADTIRRQREEKEMVMKDREITFDAGLIGSEGVVTKATVNVILKELPAREERFNGVCVSQENAREIDLNVDVQLPDGIVEDMEDMVVGVGMQVVEDGLDGGHGVLDDDPRKEHNKSMAPLPRTVFSPL